MEPVLANNIKSTEFVTIVIHIVENVSALQPIVLLVLHLFFTLIISVLIHVLLINVFLYNLSLLNNYFNSYLY